MLGKLDKFIFLILIGEYISCLIIMSNLNIFQFMVMAQIIPTILIAVLAANVASRSTFKWLITFAASVCYTGIMFFLLYQAPIQTIENNTVQDPSSIFTFNKEIGFATYIGLFIQQFILIAFMNFIINIIQKIKMNKF